MDKTIVLNVEYTMKPGGSAAFVQELTDAGILQSIRNRSGCLKYDYYRGFDDNEKLLLVEWWADENSLRDHQSSDYFAQLKVIKEQHCIASSVEKFSIK